MAGNLGANSNEFRFTLDATLPERPVTWQYSTDNGSTWTNGSGSNVKLKGAIDGGGASDGAKSALLRQVDAAGNIGPASDPVGFRLDTTAPGKLGVGLATNTGDPKDAITSDGTLNITGLDADATWQYSTDNGTTWTSGSGTSVKLSGDGDKKVVVRQTDAAGNDGVKSDAVEFTLDTVALAPVIRLNNPAGTTGTGASITTASSFVLSGVAEKGAQVVVKRSDGVTMATLSASTSDGSWSLTWVRSSSCSRWVFRSSCTLVMSTRASWKYLLRLLLIWARMSATLRCR
ncbi:MAG TPA: hypothetical protein VE092_22050, partial [Herbaspirillum sp.]|uniref:hypothetical protein n=1 Tax=Herbaspirillum sp. TaxID=1890675 RepID=UPI002D5ED6FE